MCSFPHGTSRVSISHSYNDPHINARVLSSRTRHFFYNVERDVILSSLTETSAPISSEIHEDLTHDYAPSADDFFELRIFLHHFLQIACTPDVMELKYTGPLLERLATIHVVPRGRLFSQSPEQQTSWRWLETTLFHAASALTRDTGIMLPLEFSMLPLPSHYGYLRTHKTSRRALDCAKNSRLAFHGLLGMLNLMYGHARWLYSVARPGMMKPVEELLVRSGLSESHVRDIIAALQPEILGRCVGVIVDPRVCRWWDLVSTLVFLKVPMWVIVGSKEGPLRNVDRHTIEHFRDFLPTNEDGIRVIAAINRAMSDATPAQPTEDGISPDSMHQWDNMKQMREEKRVKFFSTASDSIKARVRQRLLKAQEFFLPTQEDGTRCFVWYRSKYGRYRGEIACTDAKLELETRGRGHFQYDEVYNEWDICSLFESEADGDDTGDVDFDAPESDEAAYRMTANPAGRTPALPEITNAPRLLENHNELGRGILYDGHEIPEDIILFDSLEDVLYSRYGLTCVTQSVVQSDSDYTAIPDAQLLELYAVRKYLMEMYLPLKSTRNEFAVRYFVSCLVSGVKPISSVWDLQGDSDRFAPPDRPFDHKLIQDRACSGYMLIPRDEKYSRPWGIIISSSISTVQCLREQWGPSLEDVIVSLFQRGIDFKMVRATPVASSVPRPRTVFDSLHRAPGWLPDKYEYLEYERRRNLLLRLPHVRYAVAQGGILWRLCKTALVDDFLSGPSNDAQFFSDTSPGASGAYTFDTLSQDEIDILCGVYHISTGMSVI